MQRQFHGPGAVFFFNRFIDGVPRRLRLGPSLVRRAICLVRFARFGRFDRIERDARMSRRLHRPRPSCKTLDPRLSDVTVDQSERWRDGFIGRLASIS